MTEEPRRRVVLSPERYATDQACDAALSRGFDFSLGDWRDVFLAITDTTATDGRRSLNQGVSAEYVGPVRDAERWAVTWRGWRFDVIYQPKDAMITSVTGSGRSGAVGVPAPRLPTGGVSSAMADVA